MSYCFRPLSFHKAPLIQLKSAVYIYEVSMTFIYFIGHFIKLAIAVAIAGPLIGFIVALVFDLDPTNVIIVTVLVFAIGGISQAWNEAKDSVAKEMIKEKQKRDRIEWAKKQKAGNKVHPGQLLQINDNPLKTIGNTALGTSVGYMLIKLIQEGEIDQAVSLANKQDLSELADQMPESVPELNDTIECESENIEFGDFEV